MTDKTVPGTLSVSNHVFADLAGYAAKECYGVVGMESVLPKTARNLGRRQRLRKGVQVSQSSDATLAVDLHVILEYGVNVNAVCSNLVDAVSFVLKTLGQVPNVDVRVHVRGMKVRPQ